MLWYSVLWYVWYSTVQCSMAWYSKVNIFSSNCLHNIQQCVVAPVSLDEEHY